MISHRPPTTGFLQYEGEALEKARDDVAVPPPHPADDDRAIHERDGVRHEANSLDVEGGVETIGAAGNERREIRNELRAASHPLALRIHVRRINGVVSRNVLGPVGVDPRLGKFENESSNVFFAIGDERKKQNRICLPLTLG